MLAAVATFSGAAYADPNVQGLTLGVERVFGFSIVTATDEGDDATTTNSTAGFSLGNTAGAAPALYTIPRVHVDYILPMGLSFGGALGFRTLSTTNEVEAGPLTVSTDNGATAFLFAPRVGYLIGFNEHFGLWPRLGFSYVNVSYNNDNNNNDISQSYGALTLEAPFVFTPHKTFGFVATPSLDLGVAGSREVGNDEYDGDLSLTEFGITLGLFVVF
jgi:hypothetical protein